MKRLLIGLVLLGATNAVGAVLSAETTPSGPLGTALTTVSSTADQLRFATSAKNRGVVFMRNSAGTATAEVQQNCTGVGTDWAQVAGSSRSLTVSAGIVTVSNPFCQYRINTTACSTCNVLVFYNTQPDL